MPEKSEDLPVRKPPGLPPESAHVLGDQPGQVEQSLTGTPQVVVRQSVVVGFNRKRLIDRRHEPGKTPKAVFKVPDQSGHKRTDITVSIQNPFLEDQAVNRVAFVEDLPRPQDFHLDMGAGLVENNQVDL